MKRYLLFLLLISCTIVFQSSTSPLLPKYKHQIDFIYVSKSKKIMRFYAKTKFIKQYKISIGGNPKGHKQYQGDNRTPEGKYYINDRNPNSTYYLNLGISYPNNADRKHAKQLGKSPGGDIKIHGYTDKHGSSKAKNIKYSSTWGCIAVNNKDMREIYQLVKMGAVILIKP